MTDASLNALREKAREFLSRDADRRILLRPREAILIIDQALLWRGRCRETTIRVPKLEASATGTYPPSPGGTSRGQEHGSQHSPCRPTSS
jgi:hypothetical protein